MKIENIDVNSYPGSEKVYIDGKLHPIRVAMRRVNLTPTVKIIDGEKMTRKNDPVYVYDTSGVYTDPDVSVDINAGLPRLREEWLERREDLEQLSHITSDYGRMREEDPTLDNIRFAHRYAPRRAAKGKEITQMALAKRVLSLLRWSMWLSARITTPAQWASKAISLQSLSVLRLPPDEPCSPPISIIPKPNL